jgi:MFS family permease
VSQVTDRETEGAYRRVWANREARGLLIAQAASELGDQMARVALALLILAETDNLVLSALSLAVSFIPGIFGAAILGSLADRFPRRQVMLMSDLSRFVLVGLLALGAALGTSVWALFLLLLATEFISMPFQAARASLYPDVLPDPADFMTAQGTSRSVHLGTQVIGSVFGALLVGLINPPFALAVDAATFLTSYLVLRAMVRPRPSADAGGTSARRLAADLRRGAAELFGDPVRRSIALLAWGSAVFMVAPEAVALAYQPGLSPLEGGLLLASIPAGSIVGFVLLRRVPVRDQVRLLLPLAALACLPLFATAINPPPLVAATLWFVSGMLTAYVITVIALVTMFTARERRGRVLGVAAAGFNAATVLAFALAGWLAGFPELGPARTVSLAGAAGLVMIALLRASWPTEEIEAAV